MFVAGQPVKFPVAESLFPEMQRGRRLGRKCGLFLFSYPGIITQEGYALGIFPPAADVPAHGEEVQPLLPSPLPFSP